MIFTVCYIYIEGWWVVQGGKGKIGEQ